MKPTVRLIALTLTVVSGTTFQARGAQLSSNAPITLDTSLNTQATFEALGAKAGLNVVMPQPSTGTNAIPFKVENKNVSEALDLLSRQTGSFWTRWDDRTILVFSDSLQNRRDYDRQYLRRFAVDASPEQVLNDLRDNHQIHGFAESGNTILLKDYEPRIKLVEGILGKPAAALSNAELEDVYITQTRAYKTPAAVRTQLRVKVPGAVSLNVNETNRATFERLARMAGLNLVFGRSYPNRTHTIRIENVDFFDALDLLAIQTRSFWQPVNETTIQVLEDTPQNRRDFELHTAETIYLPAGVSVQESNSTVNVLRTMLSARGIYQNAAAKAIFLHDAPANIVVVEAVIEELSGAPVRKEIASTILDPFSESGSHPRTSADVRSTLQLRTAGTISLRMNASAREIFANLATLAGLNLVCTSPLRADAVAFNVENLDVVDALDLLALQTGMFWQSLDSRTIQVLEDTQQKRRDYATRIIKTVYLPASTSAQELMGIMNVLRTALSLRGAYQNEAAKAILVADTPNRVALAEKIIGQLNIHPEPLTSASVRVQGYAESTVRRMASVARSDLRTAGTGPVSISPNQDLRASFEALAQTAGLRVQFDPRFVTSSTGDLRLAAADVLDALDYLSLQSETFWKALDAHTILVAPDTPQVHAELDSRVSKTFYLTNTRDANATDGIINVLRTVFGLRQVEQPSAGAIAVSDTLQRIALVEPVIASLDKTR